MSRATTAAICTFLVLAAPTPAGAKLAFRGPSAYFAAGPGPTSVAIADLDRDGKADLVVTNNVWGSGRACAVSILRGKGDGTFEPHHVSPIGNAPEAIVIGDLDGDDLLDLAISNYGVDPLLAGTVSVLLGNGDGTFRPATHYPAGPTIRSLHAVDLDEDGDLDLVTERAVLLGNGDGTFGLGASYGTNADWFAAVGDLDRDGHPDLVTSNHDVEVDEDGEGSFGAYAIRLGNGDGTFQEPVRHGQGMRCRAPELADLDGDALLDLVVVNHGDDRGRLSGVLVHAGRGDGTFGLAQLFPTDLNPKSVTIADLNADGRLDLITANSGDDPDFDENSLTILLGNGDGTFKRGATLHTGETPAHVVAGRLDTNATLDLVAPGASLGMVSVFLGNGDATFGTPDRPLGRRPLGLVAADFDQDGRTDLASTNASPYSDPGGISVILGKGEGTFRDPLDSHSIGRGFLIAANLDGDLAPDLVVATPTGIAVMLANGDGTFRELAETYLDPRGPLRPALDDFDRDGRMDLAVPHHHSASEVSILLGREGGSFGPISRLVTGPVPTSAAAGDLDGDGVQDLVLGLYGHSVSVLLGHGDGTFAPHVSYLLSINFANSTPVALADLDEDGRLDVVNGNHVWIGNGDGTLRAGTKFDARDDAGSIVLEDLDGDHHVDLALLYEREIRIVAVHPGRGDGTFGTPVDYGTGAWPVTMTAGDFDGDGRTDLAVANYGSESISLLLNRSQAPVIPVRFELRPAVVNPRAEVRWVSGILELTAPHSVADVDVASIRLNGVVPADLTAPRTIRDEDRDGAEELLVRFDRAALLRTLSTGASVPVLLTGQVAGQPFSATDTVCVLDRGVRARVFDEAALVVRSLSSGPVHTGSLRMAITLPDDIPARLELVDIAGRVVHRREVGALGSGSHELEILESRRLASGIYFVRLAQGSQVAVTRAVFLR